MAAGGKREDTRVYTKVCDLRPFMKNVNLVVIVLEKGVPTKTKEEHMLAHALVADATASIHFSLWDTEGDAIQPGDILRITGGYCTLFKNALILYSGRHGTLEKTGEFTMIFSENPNMSAVQWIAEPPNSLTMVPMPPGYAGVIPPNQVNQYYTTNARQLQQSAS